MQLANIDFRIGSVNPSGISQEVYFIPKQYIAGWPSINDDFEDADDNDEYAQLDGSFTLAAGKTWNQLYTTQGKGKITWEYQGETDCKVVVNKASLSYPKINNEIRGFAKFASNGDFLFIVKHDGKFYLIGSKDYRATLTPNGDSGDSAGSAKGVTIEIECPDVTPLPTYVGNIVLPNGTLNCATGVFTPSTTHTVTYNGNGNDSGTAPTDSSSPYADGATVTVLGNTGTLAKDGYTFAGWNTKADGSGTDYAAAATFVISADTVLYAKWTS